ncbi:3-oxoacyl-[acyl-carrier protein] reductase [Lachnospiraceae bacterium TWA4]|nr:3-oxoacyl-[acyl-carrier protein] reductase [Lachnospiraceae bacterium TWA4]
MFDYKDRVVAITGASSGLGRQLAKGFAKCGANLVLLARRIDRLRAIAKELEDQYSIKALPIKCDVTSEESIKEAVVQIELVFGHCEVIINDAGGERGTGTSFLEYRKEDWDFTLNLDLTSVFTVTQVFCDFMERAMAEGNQTYGRVINIASIYGLVGNTAIPTIAYHATKGGVVNFTRGVAAELATKNITVNCICPGYFHTELTTKTLSTDFFKEFANHSVPMKRYGKEGELNSTAIFLERRNLVM